LGPVLPVPVLPVLTRFAAFFAMIVLPIVAADYPTHRRANRTLVGLESPGTSPVK
jgi:enterochelin esterase-like enzyme